MRSGAPLRIHIVEFGEVADYSTSPRNQGGDDAVDSDPQEETPLRTDPITLAPDSMNNDTVDAGYFFDPGPVAGVDGFVWNDTDGDGIQDPGEPGIDGVTVNIYFTFGGPLTPAGSTVTAGGGFYSIEGVPPADHVVEFITPADRTPTPQNVSGNDAIDSDVGADGRSAQFFLDGVAAVDVDAGFVVI